MTNAIAITNKIISECLGVRLKIVTPDKNIFDDLGADSLDKYELAMAVEREFEIDISDKDVDRLNTVGDYHSYLKQNVGKCKNPPCFRRQLGVDACTHGCHVSDECYRSATHN